MKKNWNTPSIEVVSIEATQYGHDVAKEFDYIYTNAEGNWEGTFVPNQNS